MIIVWGSVETTAEHLAEALQLSLEHVRRSRKEPGCIRHSVLVDAENRNRLIFFEEWAEMSALQAHFAVAESVDFAKKITQLAVSPPDLRIFDATQIG